MDEEPLDIDPPRAAHPAAHKRLGMVALLYAYRAIAALLIAAPAGILAGSIVSGYPRGDAELFDPGGVMLIEAVRLARHSLMSLLVQGGLGALVAAFLGLLPFAALIVALGHEGKLSARFLAARAFAPMGSLAILWGTALLAQAVVVLLVVLVGERLLAQTALDSTREDLARLGVFGLGALAALAIGVLHDLARVIAVLEGRGFYLSSARALRVMERSYGRILWAYAWRGVLTLAAIAAAGLIAHRIPLAESFWLVAIATQISIFLAVFLRASWLSAAIRAATLAPESRSLADELDALSASPPLPPTETSAPPPQPDANAPPPSSFPSSAPPLSPPPPADTDGSCSRPSD